MTDLTQTQIVNLALREIGTDRIDDFDTEASPEGDIARDLWAPTVRYCLAAHDWRFAMKGWAGARNGTTPATRYDHQFTLPDDVIRVASISANPDMEPPLLQWDIVNGCLECNERNIYVEYVYDQPAIGVWPPWFVDYLVAVLASRMASPLKSTTERERLETLANQRLARARTLSSTQQPSRPHRGGSWIAAHRGYRVR